MATIEERTTKDGQKMYRVKVRLKGHPTQTETFHRKTDAQKWIQSTESAIREGRHFKISESKRHTLSDLIDRYIGEVLPSKSASSIYMQRLQLRWWNKHLGSYLLSDLTPALIAEYRDKLAKGGYPRNAGHSI